MFFHQIEVGSEFIGQGRTLTEADLEMACAVSGDRHPIHSDEAYAKSHGLRGRLFHGSFGIFLATGMAAGLPEFSDEVVGATGIREWKYRAPLYVGDTIHVKSVIHGKRITSDGKRAVIERTLSLINQDAAVVQEGIAGAMVRLVQNSG